MLVWFYNRKWVISQMGGFCMKKIIMAAGENSQTILFRYFSDYLYHLLY